MYECTHTPQPHGGGAAGVCWWTAQHSTSAYIGGKFDKFSVYIWNYVEFPQRNSLIMKAELTAWELAAYAALAPLHAPPPSKLFKTNNSGISQFFSAAKIADNLRCTYTSFVSQSAPVSRRKADPLSCNSSLQFSFDRNIQFICVVSPFYFVQTIEDGGRAVFVQPHDLLPQWKAGADWICVEPRAARGPCFRY